MPAHLLAPLLELRRRRPGPRRRPRRRGRGAAAPRAAPLRRGGGGRGRPAVGGGQRGAGGRTGSTLEEVRGRRRSPTPCCRVRCGSAPPSTASPPVGQGAPPGARPAAPAGRPRRRARGGLGRPVRRRVAARLDTLSAWSPARHQVPVLLRAAVVHGELLALRPFAGPNGVVARAAARLTLIAGGLDPRGLIALDLGHREREPEYVGAANAFSTGTPDGVRSWLRHCATRGRSVARGGTGRRSARAPPTHSERRLDRRRRHTRPTGLPCVHFAFVVGGPCGAAATCLPRLIARGCPVAVHEIRCRIPPFCSTP